MRERQAETWKRNWREIPLSACGTARAAATGASNGALNASSVRARMLMGGDETFGSGGGALPTAATGATPPIFGPVGADVAAGAAGDDAARWASPALCGLRRDRTVWTFHAIAFVAHTVLFIVTVAIASMGSTTLPVWRSRYLVRAFTRALPASTHSPACCTHAHIASRCPAVYAQHDRVRPSNQLDDVWARRGASRAARAQARRRHQHRRGDGVLLPAERRLSLLVGRHGLQRAPLRAPLWVLGRVPRRDALGGVFCVGAAHDPGARGCPRRTCSSPPDGDAPVPRCWPP